MFSFKGIGARLFAVLLSVVVIAAGVYLTFFYSAGFVKTQATIVSIEVEDVETAGETEEEYKTTVEYTVDGTTYSQLLDSYSSSYAVGKTIEVLYDPKDPAVVHGGDFMGIYCISVGMLILIVIAVTELRDRRALKDVKARQAASGGFAYPASKPGPERRLYFLTDLGTMKGGHRIEDANRNVLFEAKMTHFTLNVPYGFDFIDHEHDRTMPHLVGHEESSEIDASLLFDNHYTFTFDGEDIWKHLRRNGISVQSSLTDGLRAEYVILRDGAVIAVATGSSPNVHEEDEADQPKLASLVPVQGFYRVTTTETDLSLLFVTLLAFARSAASDDRGGSRRILWNTLTKK